MYQIPRNKSIEYKVRRCLNNVLSHQNMTVSLLTPPADTPTDTCDDHPSEAIPHSNGGHTYIESGADLPHVSSSIISVVETCFEGLTDPVQSLETRRLMLHNYQIAIKLLRSALAVNATDRSLAAPMRALALYEVRREPLYLIYYPH